MVKIRFKKYFKNKKRLIASIAVLIVLSIISIVIIVNLSKNNSKKLNLSQNIKQIISNQLAAKGKKESSSDIKPIVASEGGDVKVDNSRDEEIISKISIPSELENQFDTMDSTMSESRIKKMKKFILEFNVGELYLSKITKHLKNNDKYLDILMAYDLVNENYGTVDDFENILNDRKANKEWVQIIKEYIEKQIKYEQRKYDNDEIKELLSDTDITTNDLMIADRLSQKGIKTFDDLISLRKKGKGWREINESLGILNVVEKYPVLSIKLSDVEKHKKSSGLSEKQVKDVLIEAKKYNKDFEEAFKFAKKGKSKIELKASFLEEKYNK